MIYDVYLIATKESYINDIINECNKGSCFVLTYRSVLGISDAKNNRDILEQTRKDLIHKSKGFRSSKTPLNMINLSTDKYISIYYELLRAYLIDGIFVIYKVSLS